MIMEAVLNSDVLKLLVVLLAIIAIVFLLLKQRKNEDKPNVHTYYISGLFVFIIIELVTYICVNNNNVTDIVSYISFASTLSSLLLSVVAIIYAIVSNNKGEAQYQKIDRASDRISSSVDRFSELSDELSKGIDEILSKLEEVKSISSETKTLLAQENQNYNQVITKDDRLIDNYIAYGSFWGNLALLACVYSKKQNRPFYSTEISDRVASYCLGYIVASGALGIVKARLDQDKIIVEDCYPNIENKLIDNIESYIEKAPEHKDYFKNELNKIKKLFCITK